MAVMASDLPPGGLTLSGAPDEFIDTSDSKGNAVSVMLVTIPGGLRDAIQESLQNGSHAELVAGKVPVSPDDLVH